MKPTHETNWYHEAGEVQYHAHVFSDDPFVRETIARNRAIKLQPLVGESERLLEYGVGIGLNLRNIRCRERVGYDLSGYGREACESAGIEFTNDLDALSGRSFSAVICHHVLEHVPCPLDTLKAIGGLLEPGGRLILVVPFERSLRFYRHDPEDIHRHLYSWNPLTLGNLLDEAGLRVSSVKLGPTGAEQRLAPLARAGFGVYRLGLWLLRLAVPMKEIIAIAERRTAA